MRHIICIVTLFFIWVQSPIAYTQINDADRHFEIIAGQDKVDFIDSKFQPSAISSLVSNCVISISAEGSQRFKVVISPKQSNANFIGKASATIQYTDGFPPKPRYITYHLNFVPSKITTTPDFIEFSSNNEIELDPLKNDISTAPGLTIAGISLVQGGTVSIKNKKVYFTPNPDVDNGYILYSVRDEKGSSANGVVYTMRKQSSVPAKDTIKIGILNTQNTFITLPTLGFTPTTTPVLGHLNLVHGRVYQYTPNKGVMGNETFKLKSGAFERVVVISIFKKSQNTSSIKDDYIFTPKNTPISFDVLENDLAKNFPITSFSSELVKESNGKLTYTPPKGFSGVKNFTYNINYGTYQATGKIIINVGNYSPMEAIDYSFNTLKNAPLAITYDVPINGYTFKVLNKPDFGTAEIFDINTTIKDECNTIKSKATLIYTPYNNYYGSDSFDIEYCVPNNPCVVYKVYIKVHDHNISSCPCTGSDCVWPGDLNGDGRVSISDILPLGRYMGLSGEVRTDIALPYVGGQRSKDWSYQQPSGLNTKHIDADGDGLIGVLDTVAISTHFGKVHSFVPNEVFPVKDYGFQLVPNTTDLDSGDLLILDVLLGTPSKPMVDLLGLVYSLNFSPHIFSPGSIFAEFYKDSWLTKGNASLQLSKDLKNGVLQAGIVKAGAIVTDEIEGFKPSGGSGSGVIGRIYAIVTDEIEGFKPNPNATPQNDFLLRSVFTDGIELEDINGEKFTIPDAYTEFRVNVNKKDPMPTEDKLVIYPNPVGDVLNLHFNGRNIIKGYKLYDAMGNMIHFKDDVNLQRISLSTSQLPSGIYVMQVLTTQGTITKKVTVSPKE